MCNEACSQSLFLFSLKLALLRGTKRPVISVSPNCSNLERGWEVNTYDWLNMKRKTHPLQGLALMSVWESRCLSGNSALCVFTFFFPPALCPYVIIVTRLTAFSCLMVWSFDFSLPQQFWKAPTRSCFMVSTTLNLLVTGSHLCPTVKLLCPGTPRHVQSSLGLCMAVFWLSKSPPNRRLKFWLQMWWHRRVRPWEAFLWEVIRSSALMQGVSPFIIVSLEIPFCVGTQQSSSCPQPGTFGVLTSGFQPPELWELNVLLRDVLVDSLLL